MNKKKWLSLFLTLSMVLSLLPTTAMADEPDVVVANLFDQRLKDAKGKDNIYDADLTTSYTSQSEDAALPQIQSAGFVRVTDANLKNLAITDPAKNLEGTPLTEKNDVCNDTFWVKYTAKVTEPLTQKLWIRVTVQPSPSGEAIVYGIRAPMEDDFCYFGFYTPGHWNLWPTEQDTGAVAGNYKLEFYVIPDEDNNDYTNPETDPITEHNVPFATVTMDLSSLVTGTAQAKNSSTNQSDATITNRTAKHVTVTAKGLKLHANTEAGTLRYWMGVGLPEGTYTDAAGHAYPTRKQTGEKGQGTRIYQTVYAGFPYAAEAQDSGLMTYYTDEESGTIYYVTYNVTRENTRHTVTNMCSKVSEVTPTTNVGVDAAGNVTTTVVNDTVTLTVDANTASKIEIRYGSDPVETITPTVVNNTTLTFIMPDSDVTLTYSAAGLTELVSAAVNAQLDTHNVLVTGAAGAADEATSMVLEITDTGKQNWAGVKAAAETALTEAITTALEGKTTDEVTVTVAVKDNSTTMTPVTNGVENGTAAEQAGAYGKVEVKITAKRGTDVLVNGTAATLLVKPIAAKETDETKAVGKVITALNALEDGADAGNKSPAAKLKYVFSQNYNEKTNSTKALLEATLASMAEDKLAGTDLTGITITAKVTNYVAPVAPTESSATATDGTFKVTFTVSMKDYEAQSREFVNGYVVVPERYVPPAYLAQAEADCEKIEAALTGYKIAQSAVMSDGKLVNAVPQAILDKAKAAADDELAKITCEFVEYTKKPAAGTKDLPAGENGILSYKVIVTLSNYSAEADLTADITATPYGNLDEAAVYLADKAVAALDADTWKLETTTIYSGGEPADTPTEPKLKTAINGEIDTAISTLKETYTGLQYTVAFVGTPTLGTDGVDPSTVIDKGGKTDAQLAQGEAGSFTFTVTFTCGEATLTTEQISGTVTQTVWDGCAHESGEAHAAVNPTCTTPGTKAYWQCSLCGKYFTTAEHTTELDSIVQEATGHNFEGGDHTAAPATCTTDGNIHYYECQTCHALFEANGSDNAADLTKPATAQSVVIAAKGHTMEHHAAKAADCVADGNLEYWECTTEEGCNGTYADAEGKTPMSPAEYTLPKTSHTIKSVAAVASSCTEAGNSAYYECEVCQKYFSDRLGSKEITDKTSVVAEMEKHVDKDGDGYCDYGCGTLMPVSVAAAKGGDAITATLNSATAQTAIAAAADDKNVTSVTFDATQDNKGDDITASDGGTATVSGSVTGVIDALVDNNMTAVVKTPMGSVEITPTVAQKIQETFDEVGNNTFKIEIADKKSDGTLGTALTEGATDMAAYDVTIKVGSQEVEIENLEGDSRMTLGLPLSYDLATKIAGGTSLMILYWDGETLKHDPDVEIVKIEKPAENGKFGVVTIRTPHLSTFVQILSSDAKKNDANIEGLEVTIPEIEPDCTPVGSYYHVVVTGAADGDFIYFQMEDAEDGRMALSIYEVGAAGTADFYTNLGLENGGTLTVWELDSSWDGDFVTPGWQSLVVARNSMEGVSVGSAMELS